MGMGGHLGNLYALVESTAVACRLELLF